LSPTEDCAALLGTRPSWSVAPRGDSAAQTQLPYVSPSLMFSTSHGLGVPVEGEGGFDSLLKPPSRFLASAWFLAFQEIESANPNSPSRGPRPCETCAETRKWVALPRPERILTLASALSYPGCSPSIIPRNLRKATTSTTPMYVGGELPLSEHLSLGGESIHSKKSARS
jgi:hypothetical protein